MYICYIGEVIETVVFTKSLDQFFLIDILLLFEYNLRNTSLQYSFQMEQIQVCISMIQIKYIIPRLNGQTRLDCILALVNHSLPV